jgi:hypothetical protein
VGGGGEQGKNKRVWKNEGNENQKSNNKKKEQREKGKHWIIKERICDILVTNVSVHRCGRIRHHSEQHEPTQDFLLLPPKKEVFL